ncbi:MAG: hypothetical protein HQL86_03795, partial [Magnetococcales bacterium]|nr:hypothetical protein [Magnetococcales bacterium]
MLQALFRLFSQPDPDQPEHPRRWLLFWLAWSLLISAIYWILGPYSYLRIQDNADFNIPLRISAAHDLLTHGLTFWQPKFSGGMPSLLHPNVDSFLIDGLPYLFLPAWVVHGLVMWLQRFLAGYFTFRLCRETLQFDPVAATFSGLAFSLYLWGVQDIRLLDALGLPAIAMTLLLFERLLGCSRWRAGLLALLLGLFTALVAQSVLYTFFILIGLPFWFWIVRSRRLSEIWIPCALFAFGIAVAESPQLLALLAYTPVTARGQSPGTEPIPIPSLSEMTITPWNAVGWGILPQNALYLGLFLVGITLSKGTSKWAWRLFALHMIAGIGSELGYWLQCVWQEWISPGRGNLRDFNQFTIFLGPLLGGAGIHLARQNSHAIPRPAALLISTGTAISLIIPFVNWGNTTYKLLHRLSTDNFAVQFQNPVLRQLGALSERSAAPFRVASVGTWP